MKQISRGAIQPELPVHSESTLESAPEQPLDKFGGAISLQCSKATGYFHVEKINNRWWFCTPEGHGFWMEGVFDLDPSQNARAKYGNTDMTWGPQQVRRIKSWGFNSIAEFSSAWTLPTQTCGAPSCPSEWRINGGKQPVPVPMTIQVQPSMYSLANLNGYAPGAVKDAMYGINRGYWRGYFSAFPDFFDPNFQLWLDGEMRKDSFIIPAENSPWVIAWITDECDELNGLCGAGPDFPTIPPGHNQRSQGLATLLTSPVQTVHPTGGFVRSEQEYPVGTVFSKAELQRYLNEKYKTIEALNAAWHSNYTAFGTTGVQVTGESIGTGDGATTTFAAKVAHPNVSAYSLTVTVGGKVVSGDCPAWTEFCSKAGAGAGAFIKLPSAKPTVQFGTIQYEPGTIAITFASPPSKGADISVRYIHDGWGYGSGLLDEDGRHSWIPTNPVNIGANAAFAADMGGFLEYLSRQYFSVVTSTIRKYARHHLVFGPGVLGTWNAPADKNVLKAATQFLDGIATTLDYTKAQALLSYTATYLGDKPMIMWLGAHANADSALWRFRNEIDSPCNPCNTQADRAAFYTKSVNSFFNTTNTVYNDYLVIGFRWWSLHDSWGEKANWGLATQLDNPYDGVSAVLARGVDPWRYATGGEEKNYGDFLSGVRETNLRWLNPDK